MEKPNRLNILWTSADVLTSEKMVLMYATNSMLRYWWDEVHVIIWGASGKLVAENELIQEKLKLAQQAGVHFSACKACAEQMGVVDTLVELGIEVLYVGTRFTELIKSDEKLITI